MIIDLNQWNKAIKKVLYFLFLILIIYIILKLTYFFFPLLIALIIANCIEPLIKSICRKTKLLRKTSAVISLLLVFAVIIGILVLSTLLILSEASDLLKNFGDIGKAATDSITSISNMLKLENVNISEDVKSLIVNNTNDLLNHALTYLKNFLTSIIDIITALPTFAIYLVITILATYFICTDRIAILDNLEQHIPKKWLKKANNQFKSVVQVLGKYLKAELILILISFIIVLIALYIFKAVGMNIESPFLISLGIGFVDLLPILGSGTVMLPWGIITIMSGDITLGIAILILLLVISLIRQFLEPRIVSSQLGMHPLYTLIAMYVGFKISGIIGLIMGPIILIIVQNFFKINNN